MVRLFEANDERRGREADRAFTDAVEAARLGAIFASNRRAYSKWVARVQASQPKRSLSDAALERAIMNVASQFPQNVSRRAA